MTENQMECIPCSSNVISSGNLWLSVLHNPRKMMRKIESFLFFYAKVNLNYVIISLTESDMKSRKVANKYFRFSTPDNIILWCNFYLLRFGFNYKIMESKVLQRCSCERKEIERLPNRMNQPGSSRPGWPAFHKNFCRVYMKRWASSPAYR